MSTISMSLDFNSKPVLVDEAYSRPFIFSYDMDDGSPSIEETILPEFHVILDEGDDNKIIGECLELNGVVSVGYNTEEVMLNMRTTIKEVLEVKHDPRKNFNLRLIIKRFSDSSYS